MPKNAGYLSPASPLSHSCKRALSPDPQRPPPSINTHTHKQKKAHVVRRPGRRDGDDGKRQDPRGFPQVHQGQACGGEAQQRRGLQGHLGVPRRVHEHRHGTNRGACLRCSVFFLSLFLVRNKLCCMFGLDEAWMGSAPLFCGRIRACRRCRVRVRVGVSCVFTAPVVVVSTREREREREITQGAPKKNMKKNSTHRVTLNMVKTF